MTSTTMSRDAVDAVLDERARALARPIVTEADVARVDFVHFGVGNERYAIESAFVFRLERIGTLTPLPGTLAHVAGLANVRGQLVPLIDLPARLGAVASGPGTYVIFLGSGRAEIGIVADVMFDIRQLATGAFPASAQTRARHALVRHVLADGSAVIDAAGLLADPRLVGGAPAAPPTQEEFA